MSTETQQKPDDIKASPQESWGIRIAFAVIMAPIFLFIGIVMSRDIDAGTPVQWLFIIALLIFGLSDGVHGTLMRFALWRRVISRLSPPNRKRAGESLLLSFLGAAFLIGPDFGPLVSVLVWLIYIAPLFVVFFAASCIFDWSAASLKRWRRTRRG